VSLLSHYPFWFPVRKFDDRVGLWKNFRYLEDFLRGLSQSNFPPYIIAPSNSINKSLADLVLTGNDTDDEAAMLAAVGRGERHFQFLDGNITGSLLGNQNANRPQASITVQGMGIGLTIWDVPANRHAILSEDNSDPANADELFTSITGISFNMASALNGNPFSAPVWRVFMWNCEVYDSTVDALGDGDTDSRGAVIWGNVFRDNGDAGGDAALTDPWNWTIANNTFRDNNAIAIHNPRNSIITGNRFAGSNTAIDFQDATGDDNVITGNYFGTSTIFANLTAGNNVIMGNYPASTTVTGITISHDSDLSDVSADDHHPQAHTIASHSDTTATGAETETLTDGSDADSLHDHATYLKLDGSRPMTGALDVDQASTSGAAPVLTLDQADVDEDFFKFIGTSDTNVDRALVDAVDFSTPGAIVGWLKINVQDDQGTNPIVDGDYYIPFYAVPTT